VAIGGSIAISVALIFLSLVGTLAPAESIARAPLSFLEEMFGDFSQSIESTGTDLAEFRQLRDRNQELERALAAHQAELAELREIRSDYERLAELVNYTRDRDWNYVTADVIGRDTTGVARTIHINRGTRNGVAVGDPVVTEQGLVGSVIQVSATGAEVLLITDQNSAVNSRLQATRDVGLVEGTLNGELILNFLELEAEVRRDDLVMTSGETQAFPADIVIGQVGNPNLTDDELFQQAPVTSFVDFTRLELVLVITNWEPVDLEVFEETPEEAQ
jgi:rod shape-determining protein MreC